MINEGFMPERPAAEDKITVTTGESQGKKDVRGKILEFARRFFRPLDQYPKPPKSFPPKGF